MSEGPEVRRIAAHLNSEVGGSTLLGVRTNLKKAQAWFAAHPGAVEGRQIRHIESCGKHILWRLTDDYYFHFHLLMFGKWQLYPPDDSVDYDASTRAHLYTTARLVTLCKGQVFDVGQGDPYEQLPTVAALGPDMCAVPFDGAAFRQRLLRPANLGREIAVVLLDQTVANGVGNYLKADILFECQINPWTWVGDLTDAQIDCLTRTIPIQGQRALANRGWTLPDPLREALEAGEIPWQRYNRHWVFRRTNLPCYICRTPIRQLRQGPDGGRWTYWCPGCQGPRPEAEAVPPTPVTLSLAG